MLVLTMNLPAHRVMGGEKSDEDDDGNEEDGLGDDNDSVDDKGGDEEIYAPVDVVDDMGGDEEMYAPVVCIGPPKGQSKGHSGTYHVHQDGADAIFASSIDGNIFIFVTVKFFLFF